ncbi:MAG: DUF418 domain-containing protein [Chloroflexi bacterium]|nr:DUF418 domain-containing protein [Chloroflexota bacterium]
MRPPAATTPTTAIAAPVTAAERIDTVDIVRGFALFGILAVNMAYFSHPLFALIGGLTISTTPLDRAAAFLIRFLAEGKFYSLFSFLFGLGLVLQMTRAEARGVAFVPLYARRLLVLLGIGLIHATLIWNGDILVTYALLGFVLLLFRRQSPRALLVWAGVLLLALPLLTIVGASVLELGRLAGDSAAIDASFAASEAQFAALAAAAQRVYVTGTFAEITVQRVREYLFFLPYQLYTMPSILAMFLLGLYAGRQGIAQDIAGHLPLIRRVAAWGLGLGLPLSLLYAIISDGASRTEPTPLEAIAVTTWAIGTPALALGYAAGLTLLARLGAWRRRLMPLAAAGRMSLSNYLMQSLVCTFIFYGYGLGLFGQVGAAAGLLLTISIYAVQAPLSVWWLRRFRFGPAEWVWRTLTYGRRQPFRLPAGS